MKQKLSLDVLTVLSRISFILAKVVLVFYGFVTLLGLFWYSNTVDSWRLLTGLLAGFSGIIAAFVKRDKRLNDQKFLFGSISIGFIVTLWLGLQYVLPAGTSIKAGIPYLIVSLCFIVVAMNVIKCKSEER